MDGRATVRQLRQEGFKNPIIMLNNSEIDTVEGLRCRGK
jgi:DNA-binding response OmpR family regulator